MAWNNSSEWKRFQKEQQALAATYRSAGMSDEQIKAMYDFDLTVYKSRRRYTEHTQEIPSAFESDDDDSINPLMKRYHDQFSVDLDSSLSHDSLWWIDELDNPQIIIKSKRLSIQDKTLMTVLMYGDYTQKEIAAILGISQQAVSKKIEKLKKYFEYF